MAEKLLEVSNLTKFFKSPAGMIHAVDDVSFAINKGETMGIVGESGCGKTTLGRVMLQLYPPSGGDCLYYGHTLTELCPKYLKKEISRLLSIQKKAKKYAKKAAEAKDNPQALARALKLNHRWLREGSKTAGCLILCGNLSEIIQLFSQARRAITKAHKLISAASKLEAKTEKYKTRNMEVPQSWKETIEANRAEAIEAEKEGLQFREQAFSFRGKNIDPKVSPKALEKEYQDKLDKNYETGISLSKLTGNEMKSLRSEMQMVFQDPSASLDPRQTVGRAIEEVLVLHTDLNPQARKVKVMALLERVGLRREHYSYYPNALSGGQKQRVCIARAIATDTRLVVLDESLAALDVSVQAQILGLLDELARDGRSYFFITHDLGVAKYFCHRIMVMYLGCECETAASGELFANPLHPYTKSLLAAIPRPEPREVDYEAQVLEGEVPNALHPPSGCFFHTRCNCVMEICKKERPPLLELPNDHFIACHLYPERTADSGTDENPS